MRASRTIGRLAAWAGVALAMGPAMSGAGAGAEPEPASARDRLEEGARLFLMDWSRADREHRRGDGLGPMFNATSCVACHGQGGAGGSGGSASDVLILTDFGSARNADGSAKLHGPRTTPGPLPFEVVPGFEKAPSVVLHRSGTGPGYDLWRSDVLRTFGLGDRDNASGPRRAFPVRASRRNTPALFGSGRIDAIPDSAIEEMARRQEADRPSVAGRPGRLEGGRIGRFGWKAQTASLGDFVRSACANELGLENPGHAQPPDPLRPGYRGPGVDLTEDECSSITAFIASLDQPELSPKRGASHAAHARIGRRIFESTGCAVCHAPEIGGVEGIYSDLLLHDMGQGLSDSGSSYGGPTPTPTPGLAAVPPRGVEWRTPPLWGLRDSAPYLHDGRASTIKEAIDQHGGQAQIATRRYKKLDARQKDYLHEFLLSLAAPSGPKALASSTAR